MQIPSKESNIAARPTIAPLELSRVHPTKVSTSGITLTTELERLWPLLVENRRKANEKDVEFTKRVLFENGGAYYIGYNMNFESRDHSKYRKAMKLIAFGITNNQWDQLTGGEIDVSAMRAIVGEIKTETLRILFCLQTDFLDKNQNRKSKNSETIRGLGDNAHTVFKEVERLKSNVRIKEWIAEKLGETPRYGEQQTLHAALSKAH